MSRAVWAVFLFSACAAKPVVVPAAAETGHLVVFVTSELKGYLGPCGCSEAMRGGIARAAAQVAQVRASGTPVLLVDSGDALFGEPSIPEPAVPQQERKAKALAEAMKAMGVWTQLPAPLDDARGAGFRKTLELPEGASVARGVAVVEGKTAPELDARAKAAKEKGASFVIGLWRTPFELALPEVSALSPAVDLALSVKSKDELAGELNRFVRGTVPLAQAQTKGRSLVRLDLYFHGGTSGFELLRGAEDVERESASIDQRIELLKKQLNEPMIGAELKALREKKLEELISRREALVSVPPAAPEGKNAWTLRFVPLESSFPEDPKVKAIVTAYDRDVGLLNVAWAKEHGKACAEPKDGEAGFVGNKVCVDCHDEALPSYLASKHPHGLETLEAVGKAHHLDCIGCHVTGWQKVGGVCRIDLTGGREGVGCESCHGPGSVHADDAKKSNILKGNTAQACTGCHDRENSPHFDFDRYVKEIIAPGHGVPAAKKTRVPGTSG